MKQFFACFAFALLFYGSIQQAIDAEQNPEKSPAANQTSGGNWKYSGLIYLLTTPEGANLPAGTTLEGGGWYNNYDFMGAVDEDRLESGQADL